jgi:hypothetical protein
MQPTVNADQAVPAPVFGEDGIGPWILRGLKTTHFFAQQPALETRGRVIPDVAGAVARGDGTYIAPPASKPIMDS